MYDLPNSFAWFAGNYSPDDNPKQLPGNCTVASFMTVLGYQGAVAADYDLLMKGGFLLEHRYTAEDCAPCAQNGGQCSVDAGEDVLVCQCSDGVHAAAGPCSEFNTIQATSPSCIPKMFLVCLFVC